MRIDPIRYMEWAKLQSKARINLTRSGWADLSLRDLGVDRESLDISGDHPYGYAPLLEAIARRYGVGERHVVTVHGASEAIFFVCAALLEPGDEVLVERPAYEPLLAVPRFFGASLSRLERRFGEGYQVDGDEFRSVLSPRTKLIILTNLHNPSGVLLSRTALKGLAQAAAEVGAVVFVNEIYHEFLEAHRAETSFKLAENIIVASSLTKAFGLGGLRCGWLLAPSFLAERMRRFFDHVAVENVFIGEQIAAMIFPLLDSLRAQKTPAIEQNLAMVRDFMRQEKKLSWVEPAHGIICFPRVEACLDGTELSRILQERYETSVVPGHFFEEPQHFRLGFGIPSPELTEGLENIRRALRQF